MVLLNAEVDYGTAAQQLLTRVSPQDFLRLITVFGDNKYHNHSLNHWLSRERPNWHIEVQSRPESATGFTLGRGTHERLGSPLAP